MVYLVPTTGVLLALTLASAPPTIDAVPVAGTPVTLAPLVFTPLIDHHVDRGRLQRQAAGDLHLVPGMPGAKVPPTWMRQVRIERAGAAEGRAGEHVDIGRGVGAGAVETARCRN